MFLNVLIQNRLLSAGVVFPTHFQGEKKKNNRVCAPKVIQSDFISIMSLLGVVLIWEQFCRDIYGLNCYLYNAGLLCTRECVSLVQITCQHLRASQPVVKPIKQDALTKAPYIAAILNICNFETIFT